MYIGEWKDDKKNGVGIIKYPDESGYVGYFVNDKLINNAIELNVQLIMDIIKRIRNIKVTLSISPTRPIALILRGNEEKANIIESNSNLLSKLVKVEEIIY